MKQPKNRLATFVLFRDEPTIIMTHAGAKIMEIGDRHGVPVAIIAEDSSLAKHTLKIHPFVDNQPVVAPSGKNVIYLGSTKTGKEKDVGSIHFFAEFERPEHDALKALHDAAGSGRSERSVDTMELLDKAADGDRNAQDELDGENDGK